MALLESVCRIKRSWSQVDGVVDGFKNEFTFNEVSERAPVAISRYNNDYFGSWSELSHENRLAYYKVSLSVCQTLREGGLALLECYAPLATCIIRITIESNLAFLTMIVFSISVCKSPTFIDSQDIMKAFAHIVCHTTDTQPLVLTWLAPT